MQRFPSVEEMTNEKQFRTTCVAFCDAQGNAIRGMTCAPLDNRCAESDKVLFVGIILHVPQEQVVGEHLVQTHRSTRQPSGGSTPAPGTILWSMPFSLPTKSRLKLAMTCVPSAKALSWT